MAHHRQTDILVVGGGPAGLLAAKAAASAGIDTLLLEREEKIGFPVHTSGATAVYIMQRFKVPERFYHPIRYLRICSPNEAGVFDFPEPVICVTDVPGFYNFLAEQAQSKGATILTGIEANEPISKNGFVVGCTATSKSSEQIDFSSKILIDASGYGATISRKAGMHPGFARFGVGAEYELSAPKCRQDEMVIIVGSRFAPSGYGWLFPWGKKRVRLGVGILHPDSRADPREYLKTLLEEAKAFDFDLTDSKIVEEHHGLVPSDGLAPNMVGNGIMTVGDAAGQASLVAGVGIHLSMLAGQLAGTTAAEAVRRGSWERQALMSYERKFRATYGRNLAIGYMVNKRIAQWDDRKWDEGIRAFRTMPSGLVINVLLSQFPVLSILSWLVTGPRWWPKAFWYGLKALVISIRGQG